MQFTDTAILIFAKAPQPGRVKTRLVPVLGEAGAAQLYRELVQRQFLWLQETGLAEIVCYCDPDIEHPLFQSLGQQGVRLERQAEGDLGERMYQAASRELSRFSNVVLLGCDCPVMDSTYVASALKALSNGMDAVIGPAEDGGYVLLGLRQVDRKLFCDISWGESRVLETTRCRLTRLGLSWQELQPLWDLDRPADWRRYRQWLSDGEGVVPAPVPAD